MKRIIPARRDLLWALALADEKKAAEAPAVKLLTPRCSCRSP
jgi:hypothetical protein